MSDSDPRERDEARQAQTQPLRRAAPEAPEDGEPDADVLRGTSYRAVRLLSHGGMGSVYLAEHRELGRLFAVKVLRAELSPTAELVERLRREARAASQIRHPGVVDVTDFGLTGEGRAFVVMEHLEGRTLAELLEAEGPLEPRRAIGVAIELCEALAAAHEKGVVHRDVKPDNVILVEGAPGGPTVKLVDFGIALSPEFVGDRLTVHGVVFGTPEYMSPEQCRGDAVVSASTDIYSLGVLLHELLTGEVPFPAETSVEKMAAKLREVPQPPSRRAPDAGIPPALDEVVLRCLERAPSERYGAVLEVAEALSAVLDDLEGRGAEAAEAEREPRASAPARPRRGKAIALGLAGLCLVALLALVATGWPGAGSEAPRGEPAVGGLELALTEEGPRLRDAAVGAASGDGGPSAGDGGPSVGDGGPAADSSAPARSVAEAGPAPTGTSRGERGAARAGADETVTELIAQAQALQRRRQLDQARATFERAARLAPGNPAVQGGLGRVAFEQGRYDDAVTHLERALRSRSGDQGLRVLLGSAYLRLGQRQRAIEQWEQVLAASPDNQAARRSLAAVGRPVP